MSSSPDKSEPVFDKLSTNWHQITERISCLLGTSAPSEEELRSAFDSQREIVEAIVSRHGKAHEQTTHSVEILYAKVVDVLLVSLYFETNDPAMQRSFVEALWETLRPTITYAAKRLIDGLGRIGDCEERVDDLLQDAFLVFESKLQKFCPERKVCVKTFMGTCFRNHFINVLKNKTRQTKHEQTAEHLELHVDPGKTDRDNIKLIEDVLERAANQSAGMAERVSAFRKHRLEGYTMQEVVEETGRSLGWVHKWSEAIEKLLREELRD